MAQGVGEGSQGAGGVEEEGPPSGAWPDSHLGVLKGCCWGCRSSHWRSDCWLCREGTQEMEGVCRRVRGFVPLPVSIELSRRMEHRS